jgi:hypothetical protein
MIKALHLSAMLGCIEMLAGVTRSDHFDWLVKRI